MSHWHRAIQRMVDQIDEGILQGNHDGLLLDALSKHLGYSPFHTSKKFRELTGLPFREYLRARRLAYALIDLRDSQKRLIDIALSYGFSSHEAFTRAFKKAYGVTPGGYRENPMPVVLRTKVNVFDRYLLGVGDQGMVESKGNIKVYFIKMPAHKFMHIKNYESDGYWDFWQRQDEIPGQDCDTVCGLMDSITGKLDGEDNIIGKFSGQIMARIYEEDGRCPEAYGIRLPADYKGSVPQPLLCIDVPEAEYVVFEHGPFDYETESESVGQKLAEAMENYDLSQTEYEATEEPGRLAYFFFDAQRFEKRVKPVRRR